MSDDDHSGVGGHGGASFDDPLFYDKTTPQEGSPDTPGKLRPDRKFEMKVYGRKLEMPDGEDIEFWGFENDLVDVDEEPVRPSSPIRVREGEIVHVTVKPAKGAHTIHMHGIEIDSHNDGVGHTSFEVNGSYTYQFKAGAPFTGAGGPTPTRGAGTYIYHCHVNTTLHYQMGMWGPLIVDPATGPGRAFHNGPEYDPDEERIWAAGDVDHRWRDLNHAAGLDGENVGLNRFRPSYFDLTGVFQPMRRRRRLDENGVIEDPRVAVSGSMGGLPVLVRYANAGYSRQLVTFEGIASGHLDVKVIASDGRPFDGLGPNFAQPFNLWGPLEAITAERYDLLITPKKRGTTIATVESFDWISGRRLGFVKTTVSFD